MENEKWKMPEWMKKYSKYIDDTLSIEEIELGYNSDLYAFGTPDVRDLKENCRILTAIYLLEDLYNDKKLK